MNPLTINQRSAKRWGVEMKNLLVNVVITGLVTSVEEGRTRIDRKKLAVGKSVDGPLCHYLDDESLLALESHLNSLNGKTATGGASSDAVFNPGHPANVGNVRAIQNVVVVCKIAGELYFQRFHMA